MMRTGDDVCHELRLGGVRNRWLEHSDDGGLPGAEPYGFVEYSRIALQDGRPEAVGEHRGARGGWAVVARVEEAAQNGAQSHHFEVRAAYNACANFARLTQTDESESDGREVAEFGDRLDSISQ